MKRYFELYKIMWNWKGNEPFNTLEFSMAFRSNQPRKILFDLLKIGLIKKMERNKYKVISPLKLVKENYFETIKTHYKLLKEASLKYSLTKIDAVLKWTNGAYNANRFFGFYPIQIKVKKSDLTKWKYFFKKNKKDFVIFGKYYNKTLFGIFYILYPKSDFKIEILNNEPVDTLKETINFCQKNIATFEHALEILNNMYGLKLEGVKYSY